MPTIAEVKQLIAASETQQGAADRITGAEVRTVDNAIISEAGRRGMLTVPNTAALSTMSVSETGNVIIPAQGIFTPLQTPTAPDNINTFPAPDSGYVWQRMIGGTDNGLTLRLLPTSTVNSALTIDISKTTTQTNYYGLTGIFVNSGVSATGVITGVATYIANIGTGKAVGVFGGADAGANTGLHIGVAGRVMSVQPASKGYGGYFEIHPAFTGQVIEMPITKSALIANSYMPDASIFSGFKDATNEVVRINHDGTVVLKEWSVSPFAKTAILDLQSTVRGILLPRMTMAQRNAITAPDLSLLIFQTDNTPGFYYYNGTAWVLTSAGSDTNFANKDLALTGERVHDLSSFALKFVNSFTGGYVSIERQVGAVPVFRIIGASISYGDPLMTMKSNSTTGSGGYQTFIECMSANMADGQNLQGMVCGKNTALNNAAVFIYQHVVNGSADNSVTIAITANFIANFSGNRVRMFKPVEFTEVASTVAPAAGFGRLYAKNDGHLRYINTAGNDFDLCTGQNFANTDLTLTATRQHNIGGYGLRYAGTAGGYVYFESLVMSIKSPGDTMDAITLFANGGTKLMSFGNYPGQNIPGIWMDPSAASSPTNYTLIAAGTASALNHSLRVELRVSNVAYVEAVAERVTMLRPLKLTMEAAGGLTVPEDGALEYFDGQLWFTVGSTRKQITT